MLARQALTCSDLVRIDTITASVCCRDQWLECARAAFASMDSAEKGHISSSQLISLLSTKLPAEEVEHAVEDALMEAGCGGKSQLLAAQVHVSWFDVVPSC